jgi:hypothetical protein
MKETLEVINRMVADGVVKDYAIGGAVAAIHYLEPFDTADLDTFIATEAAGGELTIIAPVYDYPTRRGYKAEGEYVHIEGQPVKFLPVFNRSPRRRLPGRGRFLTPARRPASCARSTSSRSCSTPDGRKISFGLA